MDLLLEQTRAWEGVGDTERLCALHDALREVKLPRSQQYRVRNVAWGIEQVLCEGGPALLVQEPSPQDEGAAQRHVARAEPGRPEQ